MATFTNWHISGHRQMRELVVGQFCTYPGFGRI